MGKTREGDVALRATVLALKSQNLSNCAIATKVNRSRHFVIETLKRYKDTGSLSSRKRSGRPALSTPRTDRALRRYVTSNPCASLSVIRDGVGGYFRKVPSQVTLRRILHNRLHLKTCRPAHKPAEEATNGLLSKTSCLDGG